MLYTFFVSKEANVSCTFSLSKEDNTCYVLCTFLFRNNAMSCVHFLSLSLSQTTNVTKYIFVSWDDFLATFHQNLLRSTYDFYTASKDFQSSSVLERTCRFFRAN